MKVKNPENRAATGSPGFLWRMAIKWTVFLLCVRRRSTAAGQSFTVTCCWFVRTVDCTMHLALRCDTTATSSLSSTWTSRRRSPFLFLRFDSSLVSYCYYFTPRRDAKYCDKYVCLSARITRKPRGHTHTHTQPFYCWSGICPGQQVPER